MATKLRFSRHGSKKNPVYWLVASDSRVARDGQFLEKLGTYNPLLSKDNKDRIAFNKERINYWLSKGAQPTEKAEKLFGMEGITINFKSKKFRKKYEPIVSTEKKLSKKAALKLKEAAENPAEEVVAAPAQEIQAEPQVEAPAASEANPESENPADSEPTA